ncbi:hypothetical protein M9H77_06785 [Catharanthus roseus]|uniref:Uncharacterized protein n=1 Tax=Catharanthus roseus TaxID=4058 RepID=A0ACC0BT35_CATRO|nr:hypothetical protein M9H77_06785 [Catharanthus roseus]
MEIHEPSTIDVKIEDIGPLVHESRSSEEVDIDVETYFEELQNDKTKIEWDSNEDSDEKSRNMMMMILMIILTPKILCTLDLDAVDKGRSTVGGLHPRRYYLMKSNDCLMCFGFPTGIDYGISEILFDDPVYDSEFRPLSVLCCYLDFLHLAASVGSAAASFFAWSCFSCCLGFSDAATRLQISAPSQQLLALVFASIQQQFAAAAASARGFFFNINYFCRFSLMILQLLLGFPAPAGLATASPAAWSRCLGFSAAVIFASDSSSQPAAACFGFPFNSTTACGSCCFCSRPVLRGTQVPYPTVVDLAEGYRVSQVVSEL